MEFEESSPDLKEMTLGCGASEELLAPSKMVGCASYSEGSMDRLVRMSEKPKLDVQVCDHCNLRCAGCLHLALDPKGRCEPSRSFVSCPFGGCYQQLAHGAVWPCQVSAHHGLLAWRFDLDMLVDERDYLPLEAVATVGDIEAFRRKSHPFCRYCDNESLTVVPWARSKREAGEWLATNRGC